jgi:hypothetical protein
MLSHGVTERESRKPRHSPKWRFRLAAGNSGFATAPSAAGHARAERCQSTSAGLPSTPADCPSSIVLGPAADRHGCKASPFFAWMQSKSIFLPASPAPWLARATWDVSSRLKPGRRTPGESSMARERLAYENSSRGPAICWWPAPRLPDNGANTVPGPRTLGRGQGAKNAHMLDACHPGTVAGRPPPRPILQKKS